MRRDAWRSANPNVKRKRDGAVHLVERPYVQLPEQEGKLGLRLPAAEREAFLKKYRARLCEAYGVVQKEYVEVRDRLLSSTREVKQFFDSSYEYVKSLKPKSTNKK
jgi:hypothetical protein